MLLCAVLQPHPRVVHGAQAAGQVVLEHDASAGKQPRKQPGTAGLEQVLGSMLQLNMGSVDAQKGVAVGVGVLPAREAMPQTGS